MDNKKIEQLLDEMKSKGQEIHSNELNQLLASSEIIIPAIMPPETDPAIMKEMLANTGKNIDLPKGANPQPCVFESEDHKNYIPVFTSEEQMKKNPDAPKFPLTLNLDFSECMNLLNTNPHIDGIVINAFTHNVVLSQKNTATANQQTKQNLSIEEFHALSRQKMEAFYLPKHLFDLKKEFVDKLCDGQSEFMHSLYQEVYDTEIASPYTPNDFEIMKLQINDDLLVVQITMPKKNAYPNTCSSVIFAYDSKKDKIWYYAFVIGMPNQPGRMIQLNENGEPKQLGDLPNEGSEISTVLELIEKEA